jgi:hypothetical protein
LRTGQLRKRAKITGTVDAMKLDRDIGAFAWWRGVASDAQTMIEIPTYR